MSDVDLKRQILINTAPDHYAGTELEEYVDKIRSMSDEDAAQEYYETWGTHAVLHDYLLVTPKTEEVKAALVASSSKFNVGDRVRVKSSLEYFPHFIVAPGATGVVTSNSTDDVLWVKMDAHIDGCEEWNNEISVGWGCDYDSGVLELIAGAAAPRRMLTFSEREIVVAAVMALKSSVYLLNALYEANPDLNDIQPDSFAECIPMSLDEWWMKLASCAAEWHQLPIAPSK